MKFKVNLFIFKIGAMYAFPQIHIPKKAVDHAIVSQIICVNSH